MYETMRLCSAYLYACMLNLHALLLLVTAFLYIYMGRILMQICTSHDTFNEPPEQQQTTVRK